MKYLGENSLTHLIEKIKRFSDYNNLINKPIIPTKTSELTNDSAYATESYVDNKIAESKVANGDIVNVNEKGMFSWKHDDLTTDYEYMSNLCDYLGLTEVYQSFRWNGLDEDVVTGINYLKNNTKNNVEVGYLCGEASWYNTTDAKAHIDKIATYNNGIGANAKITKFLIDVEPWTLDLETNVWLNDYVNMLSDTYNYAKNNNLTFGVVIPFWVDTASKINNETVYKTIIDNSDEVHIMNYNRNTFDTALDNEVAYCKTSNKSIYSIAETQEPNESYGVTDDLTYYNVGLEQLNTDWQNLKDKYNYSNLNFAYHDYQAMKTLIPTIPSSDSGVTDYNELTNKPITQLTGTDTSPIYLRTLQTGAYKLNGVCSPYSGSEVYMNANNSIAYVAYFETVTAVQLFYPPYNQVQYFEVYDDNYTTTTVALNDMATKLAGIEEKANNYSLPTASANTLGGIKVGSGLSINNGVLSAISGGGNGNVSSNVINSIVVVNELPEVEVEGVLYLVKDNSTIEPDIPDVPEEEINLYYQTEQKDYTSGSGDYSISWTTDCNVTFDSKGVAMTRDRQQSSGGFALTLEAGKTYKLKAKYVSGTMTSTSGEQAYHFILIDDDTSVEYCSMTTHEMADVEKTFTAESDITITDARVSVYIYTGTLYDNLTYNISLTEV